MASLLVLFESSTGGLQEELALFLTHREHRRLVEVCRATAYSKLREMFFNWGTFHLPASLEAAANVLYGLPTSLRSCITSVVAPDPKLQGLLVSSPPTLPELVSVELLDWGPLDSSNEPEPRLLASWPNSVENLIAPEVKLSGVAAAFSALRQLKDVRLWDISVGDLEDALTHLHELETLIVDSPSPRGIDSELRFVANTPSLRTLALTSGCDPTEEPVPDLAPLASLKQLELLRLIWTSSYVGLAPTLEAIQSTLQILDFGEVAHLATTETLALSTLTGLKRLDLPHTKVDSLAFLETLDGLEELSLSMKDHVDWSPLTHLTKLKDLNQVAVCSATGSRAQWTVLSSLPCLETLRGPVFLPRACPLRVEELVVVTDSVKVRPDLTQWPMLEFLRWVGPGRGGLVARFPSILLGLTLDLKWTADYSSLAALTRLRRLHLRTHVSVFDLVDAARGLAGDYPFLKSLVRLEELCLKHEPIRDLTTLHEVKMLAKLDLSYTHVDDVSLLADLLELEDVDLSGTEVSDVGPLDGLPRLRRLQLPKGSIRNAEGLYARGIVVVDPDPDP